MPTRRTRISRRSSRGCDAGGAAYGGAFRRPQEHRRRHRFAVDSSVGLALDANVNLKEGHNCLAYNLIRTPRLNMAALDAVPSDAIALICLGVGESGTPQAAAVSEQIRNAMGLDIGPQLFDNIEQITLFAVPFRKPTEQLSEDMPPQIKSIGLAITSVDPQQTHQILRSAMRSANIVVDETQPTGGRFDFTLPNQQSSSGAWTRPARSPSCR
jgi:hypothetical protein